MSYKFSRGAQVIGDLKAQDDTQRDTLIDFGEDQIEFQTSGSVRLQISNSHISSSLHVSASSLYFADSVKIIGAPAGQDTVIDNQGNFTGNTIDVGTVSGSSIVITDTGSPVYQLPTADGNADEVISTDGSGDLTFRSLTDIGTPSFLLFGDNDSLTNQTVQIEMKTMNGSQNNQGWRMPVSGVVTHLSVQFDCAAYTSNADYQLELWKNGVGTGKAISVTVTGGGAFGANNNITPESFDPGDRLTLKYKHSATGITTQDSAAMIRIISRNE